MNLVVTRPQTRRMQMQTHYPATEREMTFPADIQVNEDVFLVNALLPGVLAEDLDIQIKDETLSIEGEIKFNNEEDTRYLLRERPYGRFSRAFRLPERLDAEHVEAELVNGVLSLRIPIAEDAKPRNIEVKGI